LSYARLFNYVLRLRILQAFYAPEKRGNQRLTTPALIEWASLCIA